MDSELGPTEGLLGVETGLGRREPGIGVPRRWVYRAVFVLVGPRDGKGGGLLLRRWG